MPTLSLTFAYLRSLWYDLCTVQRATWEGEIFGTSGK